MPIDAQVPESQLLSLKKSALAAASDMPKHSKAYLKSLFPIVQWLPRYNWQWFIGDFIAGVTVALVIFPQAISYSTKLANLPAQFGLYTSFIGCLIYGLFATSKDVTIGPTALLSLLVGQAIAEYIPGATQAQQIIYAITLSFWVGLFQFLVGVFRLGLLVDFVPIPVIAGFTSGAGIQIIIQQLPGLLGIKGVNTNNPPYKVLGDFFSSISGTSKYDAILGVTALFFIVVIKFTFAHLAKKRDVLKYIGFLRNAIVLIVYTGVSYALRDRKDIPFSIVKSIPYGLSDVQHPNLELPYAKTIFPALPSIFIVSILEHIAVVKTYGRVNGYNTNSNQEIVAIGLTNFLGSFAGAFPATGSFSRSAIKSASGVKTPLGTFITGILVIIGLFTITDVLYYIPNAVLSAIVIAAIFELFVNFKILKSVLDVEITDFIGFFIALIVTFVSSIENGIYTSVGWSLFVLLFRIARPRIKILARTPSGNWVDPELQAYKRDAASLTKAPEGILVFKIEESLTYPNSGFFIDKLKETVLDNFRYSSTASTRPADKVWSDDTEQRALEREKKGLKSLPALRAVILDFSAVNNVDYTGLQALLDSKDDLARYAGRPVPFHFVNVHNVHINTLVRVPGTATGASVDATPGAPQQQSKNFLRKFKQSSSAGSETDSRHDRFAKSFDYFHYSIDEAIEAADEETKVVDEEITIITGSHAESSSGYLVSTGQEGNVL
ncbi:sulfate transporter family-domain-containing protein, partial [Obelidium mucronatum]